MTSLNSSAGSAQADWIWRSRPSAGRIQQAQDWSFFRFDAGKGREAVAPLYRRNSGAAAPAGALGSAWRWQHDAPTLREPSAFFLSPPRRLALHGVASPPRSQRCSASRSETESDSRRRYPPAPPAALARPWPWILWSRLAGRSDSPPPPEPALDCSRFGVVSAMAPRAATPPPWPKRTGSALAAPPHF
jgi:hypothetical protein